MTTLSSLPAATTSAASTTSSVADSIAVRIFLANWARLTVDERWALLGDAPGGMAVLAPDCYRDVGALLVPSATWRREVFALGQNDLTNHPLGWRARVAGATTCCRSLSVGDVLGVDGQWVRVASVGFAALSADEAARFTAQFAAVPQ